MFLFYGNFMDELELLDELTDELEKYKQETKYKKLTFSQWFRLDTQFQKNPHIHKIYSDIQFFPAGEHVVMRSLLNEFGYYPSGREETMKIAYDLIVLGYE